MTWISAGETCIRIPYFLTEAALFFIILHMEGIFPVDPSTLNTGGADFYIIRTVSSGGREAYIGPFWIEIK